MSKITAQVKKLKKLIAAKESSENIKLDKKGQRNEKSYTISVPVMKALEELGIKSIQLSFLLKT